MTSRSDIYQKGGLMGTSYSESLSLSDWRKTFAGHGLINHSSVNLFIYGQSVLLHMLHMLHMLHIE